jgi:hypothetical protein
VEIKYTPFLGINLRSVPILILAVGNPSVFPILFPFTTFPKKENSYPK